MYSSTGTILRITSFAGPILLGTLALMGVMRSNEPTAELTSNLPKPEPSSQMHHQSAYNLDKINACFNGNDGTKELCHIDTTQEVGAFGNEQDLVSYVKKDIPHEICYFYTTINSEGVRDTSPVDCVPFNNVAVQTSSDSATRVPTTLLTNIILMSR